MTEIGQSKEMLDTPVLWVDLDVLEANIALLMGNFRAAGVNWRPHTKGNKIPAIAHKLINAGAIGVTCAKLGEAEVMAQAGVRDILIANQVVGSHKYARLAALQRHADVKMAVDNTATLDDLGAAAQAVGVEIPVVVELNVGMNRAGVTPGTAAVGLAGAVHEQDGLRLAGLMAWEGHTLSVEDPDERAVAIRHSIGQLAASARACREAGLPVEIVSCGGSGTMSVTAHQPEVTEIQAGGAIFGDATYQSWGTPTDPALFGQAGGDEPPRARPDRHRRGLQDAARRGEAAAGGGAGERGQHLALGGAWGDHAFRAEHERTGGRSVGFPGGLRRRDGLPARCDVWCTQGHCGDGLAGQRAREVEIGEERHRVQNRRLSGRIRGANSYAHCPARRPSHCHRPCSG